MDANEREPAPDLSTGSGAVARLKRNLTDKAQNVKESLNDLGRKKADRIDGSKESTAKALAWTAASLHSRTDKMSQLAHSRTDKMSQLAHSQTDKISQLAHSAADRIQVGADYLRERDVGRIMEDVRELVRKHPGRSLAAAMILGFLIARGLRRSPAIE
jgi:ElaB/YqjD/DUF883 family membrane-anchored ribosome-binding protein